MEELAARIYTELTPGAAVVLDDRIEGESGTVRQIDVAIRAKLAGVDLLIAVETKDYGKRRADIGKIDEFANKLRDIRANKGIFICAAGFSKGAISAARKWGIQLATLHDAANPRWRIDLRIPILWTEVLPTLSVGVEVHLDEGASLPSSILDWKFSEDGGATRLDWLDQFQASWNDLTLPMDPGVEHDFPLHTASPALLTRTPDGEDFWQPVRDLRVRYSVSRSSYLGWITPEESRGILDVLTGQFQPSYLRMSSLPTARDPAWDQVDPNHLAINPLGPVITAAAHGVDRAQIVAGPSVIRRIGD